MKFKEVKYEEIGVERTKKNKIFNVLKEFQDLGIECAEVDTSDYGCAWSGTSTLTSGIRRYGFAGLKAITVKGKTYLINETIRLAKKRGQRYEI